MQACDSGLQNQLQVLGRALAGTLPSEQQQEIEKQRAGHKQASGAAAVNGAATPALAQQDVAGVTIDADQASNASSSILHRSVSLNSDTSEISDASDASRCVCCRHDT